MRDRVELLNCFFDNVTFEDVIKIVDYHIASREPGFMMSLNSDIVVRLDDDAAFREVCNAADLVLMDSQPLVKVLKKQGIEVKEKLSGSDLMPRLCEFAAKNGYKCFILGGAEGIPDRAALNLQEKYPGLQIDWLSPDYGFEKDDEKIGKVMKVVIESAPDIMFLCLGSPKSEKFFYPRISNFGVPFTFSVGAAVDFAAGNVKRAPLWMQKAGLEWFFRFTQEPRRLFKRYFVDSWKILGIYQRTRSEKK